jgi:hypothetical protein
VGGLGCVGVKLNVVQKRWLCALACTSFNFTKRWLSVLCFVCLFILCRVSLGIGHNLHIGEQKVRQAFQIGKIGEPLFRFFLRIYNYHIKLQIIKLLVMIYMPCHLLMHGV